MSENEYYDAWLKQVTQLQMPPIMTTDSNVSGPYWTMDRLANLNSAYENTQSAYAIAFGISAVDGPLPFVDVVAYTAASIYSAAWWFHALS